MLKILNSSENLSKILNRSQLNIAEANETVKKIVSDVRQRGDEALFHYTEKFDGIKLDKNTIAVTEREIDEAVASIEPSLLSALKKAKENIEKYHLRQVRSDNIEDKNGKKTGWIIRPVESVGIYVPGGKAAYPSSVLMCALPAVIAGVKRLTMVTPGGRDINPLTLAAARECGVQRVLRVGGAQSIAALAYGTESVAKADVICGPGNIYVTLAKREVFGSVGIDMIAGPSEILIIADKSANAEFVAADMLSQAEHDELSASIVLTDDAQLAKSIATEVSKQIKRLPKQTIAEKALLANGAVVVCKNIDEAIEISNKIAPEHLELCVENAEEYLKKIENAGAVFLGNYSPEPLGDYFAGPSHVLPTSGSARFFSALSVDNFIKKISVIGYGKNELLSVGDDIVRLAEAEGLEAHANSVRLRRLRN